MAQEFELSDYTTVHELQGTTTNSSGTEHSGVTSTQRRKLLMIVILTVAVLCIIQASLNISLRLAFRSAGDTDQDLFNSSIVADKCQIDQNSTQSCSCYKNQLRRLLREYQALEKERDMLRGMVSATEDYEYGSA